ncbi:MAG: NAD-dependent epimerase/dehydratase family protein [Armatimonadota bacterium]
MRVLVTGGAGFIGSQIADAHVARGDDVVVVDSLVGGRREFIPQRARFYQADIRDAALREIFARERPELVNHHAAQASVSASVADPSFDADVNVVGTLKLLELCRVSGVEHFVFASTGGALYGEPDRLPADEDTPIRPLSPYGCSKHAAEGYVALYGRLYGLRGCCLRYANVYGPRQDPHGEAGVVAIFTHALLAGQTATIHGDGEQTRDFVFVDDVVRASMLAAERRAEGGFNIGTGQATNVNTLYQKLATAVGTSAPPRYGPPRPGDVRHITLAAGAAQRHLGWALQVSLDAGLRATVEWFRQHR